MMSKHQLRHHSINITIKMKKALIVYRSRTGITKRYGEEIGKFLVSRGIDTRVAPVEKFSELQGFNPDYLFLGCWTAGFMLLFQRPDKVWKKFAQNLDGFDGKKVALFTTYKIATGSMFSNMKKHLQGTNTDSLPELRSRNGSLSEADKNLLINFTA